jgi:hypothetical protein
VLFDPRPKESREDFFDREKELELIQAYAKKGSPIILCLGVRRIGKTSLLKVFLNETSYPHLYLNARKLADYGYQSPGSTGPSPRSSPRSRGDSPSSLST